MTRVRPATLDDIRILMSIEKDSPTAAHWQESQYRAALTPGAAPERVSLVIEEPPVQGFVVAQVLGDEWEIENVVVAADARRRGLGTELVSSLLEQARARGARSIFLEVRESNAAARRLYTKSGFMPAGRRKGYYADPPEDALLFRYSFPQ
jgi:[ribosomal protein S18]-alanine N-acetyltransferase